MATPTKSPDRGKAGRAAAAGKADAASRKRATKAATKSVSKPAKKTGVAPKAGSGRPEAAAPSARKDVRQKLAVYRSKRDFGSTPEPEGKKSSQWKKGRNPFFVIQKHAATRLHYDFRLEVDGVLKSWAVPKGPSMDPADKRLAVQTEDHPIDYADFEGIIPEDEYGGGTVIVWDAGPYRNLKRSGGREIAMGEAWRRGQVEIWLEGRKIRGGFALIHSRLGGNDKNWLLVKMKDAAADAKRDPVEDETRSVLSGRTIDEVASDPKRVWSSR